MNQHHSLCLSNNKSKWFLLFSFFLSLFGFEITYAQVNKIKAPGEYAFSTNYSFGELDNEMSCLNDSCTKFKQRFYVRNDSGALLYLLSKNELSEVDTFYANWYNQKGDILKSEKTVNNILYSTLYTYSSSHKLLLVTHLEIDDTISTERYTYGKQDDLREVIGINHTYNPKKIALRKTYTYLENGVWQEIEIRYSGYKNEVARKALKRYDHRGRILLDWLDEDGNGEYEKRVSYEYKGDLTIEYKYPYRLITYLNLPMSYSRKVPVISYATGSKSGFIDSMYQIIGANHFDTSAILPNAIDITSIYPDHNQASKNTYYNAYGVKTMTVVVPSDELGGPIENREEISEYIYDNPWRQRKVVSKHIYPVYNEIGDYEVDIQSDADEMGEYESESSVGVDVDAHYPMYDYSSFTIDTLVADREWFNYDAFGNLTEKISCEFGNKCYGLLNEYDSLNRLVKVSRWTGSKEKRVYNSWFHLYVYDEDGFLKEHLEGEKEEAMHSLKYDANGNVTNSDGRKSYFGNQQFKREMGAGLSHTLEIEIPADGLWLFDLYEANFSCILRLTSDKSGDKSILYPIGSPSQKVNNPTYQLQRGTYYLHVVGLEYEDRGVYRLRIIEP